MQSRWGRILGRRAFRAAVQAEVDARARLRRGPAPQSSAAPLHSGQLPGSESTSAGPDDPEVHPACRRGFWALETLPCPVSPARKSATMAGMTASRV